MLGTRLAMYIMRKYDITEERAAEIRAELDKRANTTSNNGEIKEMDEIESIETIELNINKSTTSKKYNVS